MKKQWLLSTLLICSTFLSCQKEEVLTEETPPQQQTKASTQSLMDPSKFVSAASAGNSLAACQAILRNYGLYDYGSENYVYQALINTPDGGYQDFGSDPEQNILTIMQVLDNQIITYRKPIIAGIIHFTLEGWYQSEHYVVIVGRVVAPGSFPAGQDAVFYTYMDPSVSNVSDACNEQYNRLEAIHYSGTGYMINNYAGKGWSGHDPASYRVTHIRPNGADLIGQGRPYIPVTPPSF